MTIKLETYQSGKLIKGAGYRFFLPTRINDIWTWNVPRINQLAEKAALRLGEFNSYARMVPSIDLFIRLHVVKESVDSSRIEGTRTNMDEALLPEKEINPERRDDWHEVNNYILAMNQALEDLETLPLSSRLLRRAHTTLLDNVRGKHKLPGEYRVSQNRIGGHNLQNATYIPPSHEHVPELMSDLEKFLHNQDLHLPALVRIAIAHYQFETIHPFLDGNGRIGRLLITLYLVSEEILKRPLLYISTWFERDRELYYSNLMRTRTHNDMGRWLEYFLDGVEQTANEAVETLAGIRDLKTDIEQRIQTDFGRRAANAMTLLQHLFQKPIVSVDEAATACGTTFRTANRLIALMCEHGILREITGRSRSRLFVFEPYLQAFYSKR
ncbi:MAG: Fic family protein [Gammaproteobacteria bacterium]|nr:Fic family protein [Gammaproteobacteria bacterium]